MHHMKVLFLFISAMLNGIGAQPFPATTSPSRGYPLANSPGPLDIYNSQDSLYLQATSPQPTLSLGHSLAVSLYFFHLCHTNDTNLRLNKYFLR